MSFGGYYADGRAFVFLEFNNDGSRGGGPYADGLTAPVHNMANTPIETIEAAQPLLICRYGFVPDTGGPGRFRGGLGLVREYELTHHEASLQVRSDRARFLPWHAGRLVRVGRRQPAQTRTAPTAENGCRASSCAR